ncbi:MAG TPA: CPBP family glutamic-type intramembrane protease, partial [Methanoculleus sp.]|nr:CPBP family glutamic-type intramembrane protease [Methanoculleus sp.]
LPAILFASLHAFQYTWDGLISVFFAGIIFAYIRRYTNTTTSAITHTVYDLVLFSMLMAGISV